MCTFLHDDLGSNSIVDGGPDVVVLEGGGDMGPDDPDRLLGEVFWERVIVNPSIVKVPDDGPADAHKPGGPGHGVHGEHEIDHLMVAEDIAREAATFCVDGVHEPVAHLPYGWWPLQGGCGPWGGR